MSRLSKALLFAVGTGPLALAVGLPASLAAEPPRVADLDWLAGCWAVRQPHTTIEEQWMTPAEGLMLGMSRRIRPGGESSWEWLRLFERDGALVLAAAPSDGTATEFVLETLSDDQAVFVNPGHDFPQTIRYRRTGEARLVGSAEGIVGGDLRILSFPMDRVDCPAPREPGPAVP